MVLIVDGCIVDVVYEMSLQKGHRHDINFIYNTGPDVIFSNPYYAAALEKLASSRYQILTIFGWPPGPVSKI